MLLSLYTWNGNAINDTTNYKAYFPRNVLRMPNAPASWSPRTRAFPKLASKNLNGGTLTFAIECMGTIHSQAETLKQWFAVDDFTTRILIVRDTADSNRQWYVTGYPIEPITTPDGPSVYYVTLALVEPLWRTVTANADPWAITASGQTNALTVLGNHSARPILTITPTSAKTGGYTNEIWKPWYNPLALANNNPFEVTGGGLNTAALVADNSNKCLINLVGGITAIATTIPYDTVTGTVPTAGTGYIDTEQIRWTGKSGIELTGVTRGLHGTTAAVHADNAVIYVSRIQADGDDLRVVMNGVEVDRWISGMNGATTKVWINLNLSPKIELTLSGAIAGAGAVTTISVAQTAANLAFLNRLPASFLVVIDTEAFLCSNPNPSTYSFTVISRQAKGTSIAAHVDGATIRWIEHEIGILYGNPDVSAPTVDDTKKPMLNLSTSTNTSWVFEEFMSSTSPTRGASWRGGKPPGFSPQVSKGASRVYMGSHAAFADPASEAGIQFKNVQNSAVWQPEQATLQWVMYHPGGFTTVTVTGGKYRYTTDWPSFRFEYSNDEQNWTTLFTEATPAVLQTWESLSSHSALALGAAYKFLRMFGVGSLQAIANNEADFEMQAVTLVLNSSNVPQLSISASAIGVFYLDCTIKNNTTGLSFSIAISVELNKALVINCDTETVTYNGKDIGVPMRWNTVRSEWLDIQPGANEILFTDAGTVPGLTIDFAWEDRNTL